MDILNLLQGVSLDNLAVEKTGANYVIKLNDAKITMLNAPPVALEYLELQLSRIAPPQGEVAAFKLSIPKEVLTAVLDNFKPLLEENGASDLKLKLAPGKIEIKGSLKKAMNLPFTLEIYPKIFKNKLKVEIGQIQVMEIFSLPGLVKDIILSFVRNKVPADFVAFDAQGFIIDLNVLSPLKINLHNIELTDLELNLSGGTA